MGWDLNSIMSHSSNNDYSEIYLLKTSKYFLPSLVPVTLLFPTAIVVARLLDFKVTVKLRRREWGIEQVKTPQLSLFLMSFSYFVE